MEKLLKKNRQLLEAEKENNVEVKALRRKLGQLKGDLE